MPRRDQRILVIRRRTAILAAALVVAAAALAVGAPAALAHAQLEGTSPARGAVLKAQPKLVVFRFGENVEGSFGAVRVYDAQARRVDDGNVVHPGGRGSEIGVGLRPGLPKGSYTATYRVISADSHPVSGGLVFSIGHPGAAPETVGELLAGTGAGHVTQIAFGVARGSEYLAIALVLGGLAFLLFVWAPALAVAAGAGEGWPEAANAFADRARRLLLAAVALGIVASSAGIALQGATAAGMSFWSALDPSVVHSVLTTRFGTRWGLRLVAWVALGAVLIAGAAGRTATELRPVAVGAAGVAPAPAPGPPLLAAIAVPAAFLATSPALSGHAGTQRPVAALFALDVLHVLAMSAWVGGLWMVLFVLPAATRRLDEPDRTRLLAATLARFSPLALGCVVALATAGVTMALIEMGGISPLLHTAFGRAVLIKVVLLLALIALGEINRQRVLPAMRRLVAAGETPGAAGRLLRRTLRAEVALLLAVLGVTAALVSYAPPSQGATGPFSASTRLGPIELQTTIDPATVGANQMDVYLFDACSGAPYARTRELTVALSLPGKHSGPLPATMRRAGPGHCVADTLRLVPGRDWRKQSPTASRTSTRTRRP